MTGYVLPISAGLLLLVAFFSALACYSLRDFSRSRLDEICRRRGNEARFGVILRRQDEALHVVEFLHLAALLALVVTATFWLEPWKLDTAKFNAWLGLTAQVALLVMAMLFSVVILPWTIARVAGESFLYRGWPLLRGWLTAAAPLLSISRRIDKLVHRLSGRKERQDDNAATLTDEIRSVVDESQREGILESETRTMIHRVIELQKEDVGAVMTPRTDMVCIRVKNSLEDARAQLVAAGHSRIPVIGETTDDIIGILYAKDLLKHMDAENGAKSGLDAIVREPFYVPETSGIDTLLQTMKRKHVHMAIVLDEYGGVAGLVTMEDILEEIVGEIVDEFDSDEEDGIHQVAPETTEVDARVHIDELNERLGYDLPEDGDFDTIGGFVTTQFGRVPETNEEITWRKLRITILEADKRKISKLRIHIDPSLASLSSEESRI